MRITKRVKDILSWYESDTPGTKARLAHLLGSGRLGGTGKMVILPVDQGFEHGPARSFAPNPPAYDPFYHPALALEAGLSAYAAPLGMLEAVADRIAGQIPTILKLNSANALARAKDQAITGSIEDALRLGCAAIGLTIYPGADACLDMLEEVQALAQHAKSVGLAVVVWSYPRGGSLSQQGESAIDVSAYAAHMAALMGAHIIKVKLPTDFIEQEEAKTVYRQHNIDISSLDKRVAHVVQATFAGRRLVIFSGGAAKNKDNVLTDARAIREGGGHGSIIGRNVFQRPRAEALAMLDQIIAIYQGKE